jgi:hypothetical protein
LVCAIASLANGVLNNSKNIELEINVAVAKRNTITANAVEVLFLLFASYHYCYFLPLLLLSGEDDGLP